ncbi:TadE/TadG family type IV pilus assembly protein [Limimaricola sp.]|uniref:TadE/TadG family type IV pilus assembly protein n=1 Tax=Limimaricola sp. TaxID=2211665 RepID=UPI0025C320DA|nr:TadE/TadG family type IV pilus assembly protein [Limimaricola sp.]
MIRTALRSLSRLWRREDGTATIEFVLVFPAFMVLFVSAVELGLLQTRQAMLERGLDMAVREIRLNTKTSFSSYDIKRMICSGAGILPDCVNTMKLEMRRVDLRNWSDIPSTPDCVDVSEPFSPMVKFQNGQENQLMVLRVCSLFKPLLPGMGLGYQVHKESGGMYALVSMSAFVMEPL